jgi:hypothetical protein
MNMASIVPTWLPYSTTDMPAYHLLWTHLSDRQKNEFKRFRYITVIGNYTRRRYRLVYVALGGVWHWDGPPKLRLFPFGSWKNDYCLVTRLPDIPTADVVLARKLLIETDELRFLRLVQRYQWFDVVRARLGSGWFNI